jgi:hypothetical protein
MTIHPIQPQHTSEISSSRGLSKAGAGMNPPSLSDDEMQMIRREFPVDKQFTWYTGKGQAHQQDVTARGRHIDVTV